VKGPLLQNTGCILAISVWNDAEAVALSKKFGAVALLDKANFYIGCSLCRRAARAAIPIEPLACIVANSLECVCKRGREFAHQICSKRYGQNGR
jgi:hypothetical protein